MRKNAIVSATKVLCPHNNDYTKHEIMDCDPYILDERAHGKYHNRATLRVGTSNKTTTESLPDGYNAPTFAARDLSLPKPLATPISTRFDSASEVKPLAPFSNRNVPLPATTFSVHSSHSNRFPEDKTPVNNHPHTEIKTYSTHPAINIYLLQNKEYYRP